MNKIRFYFVSSRFVYWSLGSIFSIFYNIKNFRNNTLISLSSFIFESKFGSNVRIYSGVELKRSSVGDYTYIGKNSIINNTKIGNYCSIASNVKIVLGKHPLNFFSTSPSIYDKKAYHYIRDSELEYTDDCGNVVIGNDVWIGSNVIILDDVKIGNGVIVAAGSIVTKDVEPYSVVGGVPAKVIKHRFNELKIKKLEESKWWEKRLNGETINELNNLI